MALGIRVDTVHPIDIANLGELPFTVRNVGSSTVYYKQGQNGSSVTLTVKDGEIAAGASLQVTQPTWVIAKEPGAQLDFRQAEGATRRSIAEEVSAGILPNILEYGAVADGKTDCTAAINAAIAAAGKGKSVSPNGATIFCPKGVYLHEGEINLKGLTGVHLVGAGAQVGGGGVGVGEPLGATMFIYGGSGARAWDFRQSVGCDISGSQCFAWGSGFTGAIWDLSGTEAKPSALGHFVNARAEATRVGGKSTEEIVACVGALLDYSNVHIFDSCAFSSCEYGVQGISTSSHSAVAHRFNGCFFAGNQKLHVANPQESWEFSSCVAESLFNRKAEILNKAGFIGYSGAGFKSLGLNLNNCWTGSNIPASREGVNVSFAGEGLNIVGGSYNTGEIGVFFKEGCVGNTIQGARFWKLNFSVYAEGAKTKDSIIMGNRHTEIAEALPVSGSAEGKEYKGCIIQDKNEAALKVS